MIKYRLFQSKLKGFKQCLAKVNLVGSYQRQDFVNLMLEMGTPHRAEELVAFLSLFEQAVFKACSGGYAVHLEKFLRFEPVIQGRFEGLEDQFQKPRNKVQLRACVTKGFNQQFDELSVEKLPYVTFAPVLHLVEDFASGQNNAVVSRNQPLRIRGERLNYLNDPGESTLYFVNADTPTQKTGKLVPYVVTDTEILLTMPPVEFEHGYFELCRVLDMSHRTGKSEVMQVIGSR